MAQTTEPESAQDLRGLLLDYLDFYRAAIATKASGLTEDEFRSSRLPSQWTPAGLLTHLTYMERRWLQWGFLAEPVAQPWGDSNGSGWVTPSDDLRSLLDALDEVGTRTRQIVQAHELTDIAAVGGRFDSAAKAPRLQWILLHVLQEYARHAGHLDIARELIDGTVGEDG